MSGAEPPIGNYTLTEEQRAKARAIIKDEGEFSEYAENLLKNENETQG